MTTTCATAAVLAVAALGLAGCSATGARLASAEAPTKSVPATTTAATAATGLKTVPFDTDWLWTKVRGSTLTVTTMSVKSAKSPLLHFEAKTGTKVEANVLTPSKCDLRVWAPVDGPVNVLAKAKTVVFTLHTGFAQCLYFRETWAPLNHNGPATGGAGTVTAAIAGEKYAASLTNNQALSKYERYYKETAISLTKP